MFFETTIMGNTVDLAMIQKMIIDTLHKEGKSQRVITEGGGCSRSAVSKHIKCKVDWKEEIGKKNVHTQQRWPQAWEYWEHRQKHLTWTKEKNNWTVAQWSKVLFSDESKCCISFVNQGPRVWRKRGETHNPCSWSPVWSFHSQWWFGLPCHLLVLVHCVFWSPQSTQSSTRKV